MGETAAGEAISELKGQVLRSKELESHLVETKEKFNELVDKSTALYQSARKISNSFCDFVSSINLFLQSEELMIPLKEIQKGINDLLPEKVEKHVNYLIKIFGNTFEELIEKKAKEIEIALSE